MRAEVKGTGSIMLTQPFAVYPKTEEIEIPDEPEVVPVDNTTAVIDNTDKVIYGLEEGVTDFSKFVKVTGDAQLSITPTENGYGTGTVIDVIADGKIINTYKVIIFGDVDGDGYSNAYDSIAFQLYMSYNTEFSKEQLMSGDINNDGIIDETDMIYSNLSGVFLYTIPQTRT
ncbi:hypothetical protein SDC9_127953 [bioreactor metagenome]|uniref:Dockerin domain-containing protein n=1 Tax=bioreactor metagenome TaxID=1076179 RepID=A0A645CW28_9ZZZZ